MRHIVLACLIFFQLGFAVAATIKSTPHIEIVDSSWVRWLLVLAYLAAIACSVRQWRDAKAENGDVWLWQALIALLTLLVVNKLLGLQGWLITALRDQVVAAGWYNNRYALQLGLAALLATCMIGAFLLARRHVANVLARYKLIMLSLFLLGSLTFLRVVFRQQMHFSAWQILGLQWHVLLELISILIMIYGAFAYQKPEYPITIITKVLKKYVVISANGEAVACPQCATQAASKGVQGRVFKCKRCGYKYSVRLAADRY